MLGVSTNSNKFMKSICNENHCILFMWRKKCTEYPKPSENRDICMGYIFFVVNGSIVS